MKTRTTIKNHMICQLIYCSNQSKEKMHSWVIWYNIKLSNIKGRNKEHCTKKKLNPNWDIRRVVNKLATSNKENKNGKQNSDDENSVIVVSKCFSYPPSNNPPLTLNVFSIYFILAFTYINLINAFRERGSEVIFVYCQNKC